jgi:uncharacterized protein YbjT (DUF2867 family)
MGKRTAFIAGSTGAIGRQLMPLLEAAKPFDRIVVLHHRATGRPWPDKVEERVVDFARLPPPREGEDVEAVFCCVGTTQKKAGSTPAFQRIDRDTPIALARWAAANNATAFVGISSVDANAASRASLYLRTKGEMEAGVAGAGGRSTYILRPSVLAGERDDYRLAERIAIRALSVIGPVMLGPVRKYRAVNTKTVANAMLACARSAAPGVHIVESDAIQELGG